MEPVFLEPLWEGEGPAENPVSLAWSREWGGGSAANVGALWLIQGGWDLLVLPSHLARQGATDKELIS